MHISIFLIQIFSFLLKMILQLLKCHEPIRASNLKSHWSASNVHWPLASGPVLTESLTCSLQMIFQHQTRTHFSLEKKNWNRNVNHWCYLWLFYLSTWSCLSLVWMGHFKYLATSWIYAKKIWSTRAPSKPFGQKLFNCSTWYLTCPYHWIRV